jgi:hypothetical protein
LIRATYGARGAALGLQRRPNEGPDRELLRAPVVRALALGGRDPALRAHAHDLALAWLSDPKAIDPDLVEVLLTAAAKSNDGKLFDGLLQRAHAEKDHRKLGVLMQALGAFTDPALVRRAQEVVMGTALDLRETWQIFYQEFADRSTRELAWSFLQTSFDVLAARMREDEVGFELVSLTEQFCDDEHADAVQAFLGPRAARYDGVPLTLANAIDSIRQCAANYRRNRASLDAFLARY